MDSLYMRRFNASTPLDSLLEEQSYLSGLDYEYSQEFTRLADSLSYSEAQRYASKLASVRAKYSYISRLTERKRKEQEPSRMYPFPQDYYGSLGDVSK